MNFDFALPLNPKDLLESSVASQYVVNEVYSSRQVADRVMGCKTALRTEGPVMILDHFDGFYSLLHHFKTVDPAEREIGWELLIEAQQKLINQISSLEDGGSDPQTSHQMLNTLKMLCYVLCRLAELFEAEACKPTTDTASGKGRGRKKTAAGSWDWEAEKERFLELTAHLLQLELFRLWDPPVVEEEFVNLISGCCYKMFENPTVSQVRCQGTRAALIQVLGILVKRYNHALSASLKIIQLLQHFEHVVSPMAQAVHVFVEQFGIKSVASEIMRELGSMDPQDLARDNSGTRAYAAFLVEVAEKIPAVILPSISVLLCHLDGESYTMRNGVLGVMGEIVMKVLSKENLDKKAKATRDQLLDTLEDHIHDVNSFVRARVLKIWLSLCEAIAIPLSRQHGLLELVVGRLHDKTAGVRKGSVQLIKALLMTNPFAAKLPVSELQSNLEKEEEKLKQLMPEGPSQEETEVRGKAEESWAAMESGIQSIIKQMSEGDEQDESISVEIAEDTQVESTVIEIRELLDKSQYRKAVSLLKAAMDSWPDYELFVEPAKDENSADEEGEADDDECNTQQTKLMEILKALYVGEQTPVPMIEDIDFANPEKLLNADTTEGQDSANEKQANEPVVNELTKQQVLVQYIKACVNFAKQVQQAVPVMCQLLGSKTPSDVMEAIEFFVTAFEFGVSNSMEGVRRMMVLVFSKEPGIKEAVVAAYRRLYLDVPGLAPRARASVIVKNLMSLTIGATLGEHTSLEELVSEFMKSNDLPPQAIQILWEYFTMKHANTTEDESRGALSILGMAARSDVKIVKSNIDVLVSVGLGERAHKDFLLAQDTCATLLKLAGEGKPKILGGVEPFRLPANHDMFVRIADVLVKGVEDLSSNHWVPFSVQAVTAIYRLAEHPDQVCGDIIKQIAGVIMKGSQVSEADNEKEKEDDGEPENTFSCSSGILSRFLALSGQVAFQQLVHLDVMVLGELKRRRNIQKQREKNKDKKKNKDADKTQDGDGTTMEDEMGLTGASAEDSEAEYIRKICELDIVTGENLLAFLGPLVVMVCSNPGKFSDPDLRSNAALALAQFMLVSSKFCEAHLQLLFTILEKAPEPTIRANTIIAVGDLTFHFPNLIEPWTPNLYARLRDESAQVRKNTLMALTHLILNDMVKVKGQISEMATCIVDADERIAALSKLFFFELSKKGNAIYNIMPDMISRLSDPETGLPQDQFKTVMRYLFAFIHKDRQADALVEKLCHRFRTTRTERQPQDLAFCLALLNYSEKGMRKLQENFACYADKVSDPDVFASFTSILGKAKKFTKPEVKVFIDEFEKNLTEVHTKGMEDDAVAEKAGKASAAAGKFKKPTAPGEKSAVKKQPAKGCTPARRGRRKQTMDSSDEEEEDTTVSTPTARRTPAHPASRSGAKKRGRGKKMVVLDSSDEDSDDELFDVKDSRENSDDDQENDQENQDPAVSTPSSGSPKKGARSSGRKKLLNTGGTRTSSRRRPIIT
ncbi:LOW QUALITY PROTEIN: condensin complex subunit 1-like [Amphiura filiformis]|uniref:LOW QUALITY PROTEIN: condensin complex subunit 1-like n=1 Tax=Amphiura filiformis TaxID=82378 RepID=UPI003B21AD6A